MAGCCNHDTKFDGLSPQYKRALWWVIAINGIMFFIEIFAGISANSQALQADALDFLADTATYAISLLVIGKSLQLRSNAALFKGFSLSLIGCWVLLSTLYRVFVTNSPTALTMGSIGFLALAANLASLVILMKYRDGDANVRSVWLCSRNDAIGNVAVIVAAAMVWGSQSAWPDLIVAAIMASLFLSSSWQIIRQALAEKRTTTEHAEHLT
ncbi:Co/Zn/Cd efflux system component [Sinobacterium caligoides]|uniref:Co/Zn/Cd efflux system component n=1 Tax=Sinobacterium caligoides TaxID=933926 RepID=A0A3N2DMH0_9GAMM|nr:cation transporter [Sinobacterium caligoides]ROS01007.1 Co/Zn/Cd efflux system component [Sinobacterium caligoides]